MADSDRRSFDRVPNTATPDVTAATEEPKPKDAINTLLVPKTPDELSSTTESTKKRRKYHGFITWWTESTAALLVAAAAIASFATLYPYQGRPLPDWPYSITIGALLSIYSVVLRLASAYLLAEGLAQLKWRWFDKGGKPLYDLVLHDDATRGPLGAASLLWRLPIPRTWQWLGCVLIVLSLLIGPFTQQVLQYYPCSWPADSESRLAAIPITSQFFGKGLHQGAGVNTLTIAEQAAINSGIYSPGLVGTVCQSGNCTFPPYTSLGFCSMCEDVSSHLIFDFVNTTSTPNGHSWEMNVTSYDPEGLSVSWIYEVGNSYRPAEFAAVGAAPQSRTWLQVLIGLPNRPFDPATGTLPSGCSDEASNGTWRCQGYGAANCYFMPCTRTYQANITNGNFQEEVISTNTEFGAAQLNGRYAAASIDRRCLISDELDFLRRAGSTINDTTKWIPYETIDTAANDLKQMPPLQIQRFQNATLKRGCLYALDLLFTNGLESYMTSAFSGNLTGTRGENTNAILTLTGSPLLQTIYNYGNFSLERTRDVFSNVSLSLTNYMRLNPGRGLENNGSAFAEGYAYTTKTCLRVEWGWLALPALLAILTLAFFVGVVLSSGRMTRDVRTWKHSPLPLVFHGPQIVESSQHVDDMNHAAKSIRVQLITDENGEAKVQESNASP